MEIKLLKEQAQTTVSNLRHQARVLGSSGKGYGEFARVNREAASLIQELLAQIETKNAAVNFWSAQYKMMQIEASACYSEMKHFEKKAAKAEKQIKKIKKHMPIFFKWRKRNG
ncbi:hypothetical protein [Intestinibacillus sp. Marseille-P6563]|uniref:hypothetical protein n=1 Tax=Intestinibacillus sp. Marseille-P6563 TaxID=2364792 RepID=UPI0019D1E7EB|nr:hypothetical protein [Intestinibacillus sp. Marseille-P6563]